MLSQPQRRNICGRASLSSSAAPPRQTPRFTQGDRSVGPGESSKYLLIGLAGAGSGFPADRASGSPCRKRGRTAPVPAKHRSASVHPQVPDGRQTTGTAQLWLVSVGLWSLPPGTAGSSYATTTLSTWGIGVPSGPASPGRTPSGARPPSQKVSWHLPSRLDLGR